MTVDIGLAIRDHIADTYHLSLGTCVDNKPWVSELHFAYDDDLNLYFRSLTSRRHSQEIAQNPAVSGTVVRQFALGEYPLGIYFEGRATKLAAGPERTKAFKCIKERLDSGDEILAEADKPDGHQFYKIAVSKFFVFGKLDDTGGQKYELAWGKA